jgi:hypothetical protein
MFEFHADIAGTTCENADETDAAERRWPTETKIVYPGQRSDCVKMKKNKKKITNEHALERGRGGTCANSTGNLVANGRV